MNSIMRSFQLQNSFIRKLKDLEAEKISAVKIGEEKCQKCGLCCWVRPCDISEKDIPKIAKFLKVSEQDLFKNYLIVDKINSTLCILPRRVEQEDIAGTFISYDRTYDLDSPCIFLSEDNTCKIYPVRPQGAKEAFCWTPVDKYKPIEWPKSAILELGWDGEGD